MARLRFVLLLMALLSLAAFTGGPRCDCDEDEYPICFSDYAATEVTTTTARLNARLVRSNTHAGIEVRFLYREGSAPFGGESEWVEYWEAALATEYQTVGLMQDFSAAITDLTAGTLYSYLAVYRDQNPADYGRKDTHHAPYRESKASFTTASAVETVDALYPSTTMALLRGNLPDMGGTAGVEVYFMWGESHGVYTHESPHQTVTAPGEFTQMITGPFNIGSTYYFVARAGAGQGEEKSFTVQ